MWCIIQFNRTHSVVPNQQAHRYRLFNQTQIFQFVFKSHMFRSKAIITRRSPTKCLTIKIKCTYVNDNQTYPGGFHATDTDVRVCCNGHKTGCDKVHVTGIWWQCTFKIMGISGIEATPDIVRSRMYHHHQQQQHFVFQQTDLFNSLCSS